MNWISTKDRLPEIGTNVLFIIVVYRDPYRCFGLRTKTGWVNSTVIVRTTNKEYFNREVKYWMPYPELPKIEQ